MAAIEDSEYYYKSDQVFYVDCKTVCLQDAIIEHIYFQLGLWILANSIGNFNTARSQQIGRKQFVNRWNRSPPLGKVAVWVMHLYYIVIGQFRTLIIYMEVSMITVFAKRLLQKIKNNMFKLDDKTYYREVHHIHNQQSLKSKWLS